MTAVLPDVRPITLITGNGANTLGGMLADLARTAGKDATLPSLSAIRLHTEGGMLHGWSTDRFRAAHAAIPAEGDLAPVILARVDAEQAAKALRSDLHATIAVNGDKVTVSSQAGITLIFSALSDYYQFPNIRKAISPDLPTEHEPVMVDAAFLADFAAIGKRRKAGPLIVPGVGKRPTQVGIGEYYRAWVMPRYTKGEATWLSDAW